MEDVVISEEPVWVPSANRVSEAAMTKFRAFASERARMPLSDTPALHAWSLSDSGAFWEAVWDYFSVVGEKGKEQLVDGDRMLAARFFPDAQLNLAENLLAGGAEREGTSDALVFRGEDGPTRRWSWDELRNEVSRLQQALAALGVGPGDRVAGLLPNLPEAVAAMLATISLGAVWSAASPDFGVRGVLDRFGQIEPKVLFTADGYWYAGKRSDLATKLAELQLFLPSVTRCVVVGHLGDGRAAATVLANGVIRSPGD
jgi:acetoacetyl-CoA synthetase